MQDANGRSVVEIAGPAIKPKAAKKGTRKKRILGTLL